MGRGRAKAKQTKVARELKYAHQDLDVERLTKELGGSSSRDDVRSTGSHEPESERAH